jgi:putative Mg2+ transporter-C (MgtC) family protein
VDTISAPVSIEAVMIRLVLAAIAGAAVGLNRELQQKPAGLRTHALVALGAALLAIVALLLRPGDGASAARIIQGIVSGIGFIGAGVILHRDDTKGVHGLTTAAAVWTVAAVGIVIGLGLWRAAIATLGIVLVILAGGEYVDRWLHQRFVRR